jgi:diguanylate cyclase (GGDEF)-like protein
VPVASPTPQSGVSRPALARSRAVRLLTGFVFLIGALSVWPAFAFQDIPTVNGIPAIVVGLVSGVVVLTRRPPPIGTVWNHALLVAAYAVPVLAYFGSLPHAAPVTSAFTFTGALVAFRLTDPRHIAAHLAVVFVLLLGPIALGLADRSTLVAVVILAPAIASLAAIVQVVLVAAETQGDDLELLVRRDPLTGVGNRRVLSEVLDYEFTRHDRSGSSLALIALDLNGFKRINDTLGHAAGDDLLVAVASTLRQNVRAGDTIVRQGGDEFCVLLPETTAAEAAVLATTLRAALAEIIAGAGPLSTGVGIAEYPADATGIDDMLRLADARLRADKASDESAGRAAVAR